MKSNVKSIKSGASTFFKVLKYLKKYLPLFIISLILTLIVVALTLYIPILIGNAIDLATGAGNVDIEAIAKILFIAGFCIAFTAIFQWVINVINNRMVYGIVSNIRHEAFLKLQSLPISFADSHQSGDIVNRLIADSDQFSDGLLMGFSQFFNGIMTIIGTIIFMFSINVPVTLIVLFITPLSLFVASFIAKRTFTLFKKQSNIRSEQTALIDEMIGEHKTVTAFGYEKKAQERFDEINKRLGKTSLKAIFFSSLTNPSTRFVNSIVYAFVAFAGAMICTNLGGEVLRGGMLSSFLSYATQYTKPFNEISGVVTELQNALASAERVFDLIESPSEKAIDKNEDEILGTDIEFKNVKFGYVPEKTVLKNISLYAKPGQKIAFVGSTGAGKTTITNLINRFYDIDSGIITIDDIPIMEMERDSLRRNIAMVLQDTHLFTGTVRENIRYGRLDATDAEVEQAARTASAHSFIVRLEHGYDPMLEGDGANLSQGQRQLINIARAAISKAPILILDEASPQNLAFRDSPESLKSSVSIVQYS